MIKSILLILFFTIPVLSISFAAYSKPFQLQDSTEIVFKDTIHVRGKVVDEKGKPLGGIEVSCGYYRGLISSYTKADGNFFLKNVQPNDTLFFEGGNRYAKIPNEGSRVLNLTLPELKPKSFLEGTVTAKRQMPKESKISTLKIEESGGNFIEYGDGPRVYGGYSKFIKYLQTELIYPEKARMASIEGMVKIDFIVDIAGKLTAFKTIQGLGYGCEEAVIDVLNKTKWKPGVYNGYPYLPTMSVKVLFKLNDQ